MSPAALLSRAESVSSGISVGHGGQISLVQHRSSDQSWRVDFVRWMSAETKYGQVVRELNGEAVYSMTVGPYAQPFKSFGSDAV
eukprot:13748960-Alexandrium_andersonii.AAC.1